jgi:hypothetical protein
MLYATPIFKTTEGIQITVQDPKLLHGFSLKYSPLWTLKHHQSLNLLKSIHLNFRIIIGNYLFKANNSDMEFDLIMTLG